MKKILFGTAVFATLFASAGAVKAQKLNDIFNQVVKSAGNGKTGTNNTTSTGSSGINLNNLSNSDIASGLKQALQIGAQNASGRLSAVNGFFGNSLIKVLMPPEAQKVESSLRQIGLGSYVDKAILSMNRAAEDAAGKAAPIFINAITAMSIQDGVNILKGGNGAATNYLKLKTTQSLTDAFKPVISASLAKVGATAYWTKVFTLYNQLPTTMNKINPDLTSYVTERALNGLFVNIADEENKIRTNPSARVTDLLQKVFSAR